MQLSLCTTNEQMQAWYHRPTAMVFNYAHQMDDCCLDTIVCLTAMECKYARQMDNCSLDAIVVPLPWSATMHTKWKIAGLKLLVPTTME